MGADRNIAGLFDGAIYPLLATTVILSAGFAEPMTFGAVRGIPETSSIPYRSENFDFRQRYGVRVLHRTLWAKRRPFGPSGVGMPMSRLGRHGGSGRAWARVGAVLEQFPFTLDQKSLSQDQQDADLERVF
ncbi:MAG: hypothetical protein AAF281_05975 [Pseudomonadota bacterium]